MKRRGWIKKQARLNRRPHHFEQYTTDSVLKCEYFSWKRRAFISHDDKFIDDQCETCIDVAVEGQAAVGEEESSEHSDNVSSRDDSILWSPMNRNTESSAQHLILR
jgi:hypothetical protein